MRPDFFRHSVLSFCHHAPGLICGRLVICRLCLFVCQFYAMAKVDFCSDWTHRDMVLYVQSYSREFHTASAEEAD